MSFPAPIPFLTEADPQQAGEGSLDPLGLSSIADRLADRIAPDVTARMGRIRFLTAIAVGATVAEELGGCFASDEKTPAYMAYEWLVVEAFARYASAGSTQGTPGIQKARTMLDRSWSAHMDAGSYLQVPKVFGFHGVYKRLGRGVGLVDQSLSLAPPGEVLLRAWEREQGYQGFVERTPRSDGESLARRLREEVGAALGKAQVATSPRSHLWRQLAESLSLDGAKRRERLVLWHALIDERKPIRRELVLALRDLTAEGAELNEAEALRAVIPRASPDLKARLAAIDAYERVARLLIGVLLAMRAQSTRRGLRPVRARELVTNELVLKASDELPKACRVAARSLPTAELAPFEEGLGGFSDELAPVELVEAVLIRHEQVQEAKGSKRPWLERIDDGFWARGPYQTTDESVDEDLYIHPYRIEALSTFVRDLRIAS